MPDEWYDDRVREAEHARWDAKHGEWRICVEQAHALCGLFWAIHLWLEREDAFARGRECEAECWSCVYQDCGHRRAPGCE